MLVKAIYFGMKIEATRGVLFQPVDDKIVGDRPWKQDYDALGAAF